MEQGWVQQEGKVRATLSPGAAEGQHLPELGWSAREHHLGPMEQDWSYVFIRCTVRSQHQWLSGSPCVWFCPSGQNACGGQSHLPALCRMGRGQGEATACITLPLQSPQALTSDPRGGEHLPAGCCKTPPKDLISWPPDGYIPPHPAVHAWCLSACKGQVSSSKSTLL